VTERLYYTDSYLTEFDATVLRLELCEGRPAAVLDRSAFYPTSGGQPFDTGRLGNATVVDVLDRDDREILHVIDRPLDPGPVHGAIDWGRRFEHMQQHSGQHVLSAAFDRIAGARTESFHLGSVSSTIDLDRTVTPGQIERAEDEANRIVWEDHPIVIRFADAEEALKLPLRKEPARAGELRLIEMTDFDISACGGTHVARTGAIGTIAIASSERFRGGTRIEFVCGVRALRGYRNLRDTVAASIRLVSVLPADLPAAIERLQGESKEAKRQIKDLQTRLAAFEGAALADRAEPHGALRVVVAVLEGWDQNGLKAIASAIAARPTHVAALFTVPTPSAVVIARASDVPVDCNVALKRLVERFGGKGGGRPEFAQGGGLQGAPDDLVSFARGTLIPS
jgi:alanyl-tRNA synthetase